MTNFCSITLATICLIATALRTPAQEPYASQIASALPKVERALGLPFKHPPRFEVLSRAEVRRHLARMLDGERPAFELGAEQRVMRVLGIISDTTDWHALQLSILAEQVVGFYDPSTKVLYLEDDPDDPTLGIVIPHELVHTLQDQYMDLDSLASIRGDDDRVIAAQAALEGQATLVAFEVALGLGPDFPGSDEAIRESVQQGLTESPVLASAPTFVRQLEIFPYLSGLEFMTRFQRARAGRQPFDAALPTSSAQVLHDSLYFASPRTDPLRVSLPPPALGSVVYENDLGEIGTRALLEQLLRDRKRAVRASVGWAGDRFALIAMPAGDAVVWLTVWRTAGAAAEYADAIRRVASRRYPRSETRRDGAFTRYAAGTRSQSVWTGVLNGHSAVLYVDAPSSVSTELVDPAGATIGLSMAPPE